ncbi:hypothetical protein Ancab_017826 [Ancistrocladus abbreviatus]
MEPLPTLRSSVGCAFLQMMLFLFQCDKGMTGCCPNNPAYQLREADVQHIPVYVEIAQPSKLCYGAEGFMDCLPSKGHEKGMSN